MKFNKLIQAVAVAGVFASAVNSAQASSSLTITTSTPTVTIGQMIKLEVHMDFSDDSDDETIGGDFNINFDPSLVSYVSETYITDPGLGSDPGFTRDDNPASEPRLRVTVESDRLAGAAFGSFGGLSGPALVGPLSFVADAAGQAFFSLDSEGLSGFFSTTGESLSPDYGNVTIVIEGPSEVPVPAAVWLFGSGLLGLIGMARRRTA